MGFYSLSISRHNVKVPNEYCYLVIHKYTDNNFRPQEGKKKLSAEELKNKKEKILNQQETIKQLDTGYYNLYNQDIKLDHIFDSSFIGYMEDKDVIIYKIKPLASKEEVRGYYSRKCFNVSEFNVEKKFKNKEEIIEQIYKDELLTEFSAIVFDSYSYGNEDYPAKLQEYFHYIKNTFSNFKLSLSDIMLTNDYTHAIRSKFNKKEAYEITRTNIRYLLDNNLIEYFKDPDYYKQELIIGLIDCGLFDVALKCVKLLNANIDESNDIKYLLEDKNFDVVLRKWSTNKDVKEIISFLNIKLSGITLTVKYEDKDDDDWNGHTVTETKTFDNIGEVKTYLIKNYDVPFEEIMNKDINDMEFYDEEKERSYTFEVI